MNRTRRATTLPVREADLVKGIVEGLRYRGRTVLVLSQWRGDKAGSTPGAPDILVWCPKRCWWLGLEAKTPSGRIRPEQRALMEAGMVVVVRSIDEAFEAAGETRT